jgi:hypothetical protein
MALGLALVAALLHHLVAHLPTPPLCLQVNWQTRAFVAGLSTQVLAGQPLFTLVQAQGILVAHCFYHLFSAQAQFLHWFCARPAGPFMAVLAAQVSTFQLLFTLLIATLHFITTLLRTFY